MDLKVSIEENKYMEKFFKNFPQYEEQVKENIYHKLPEIITYRPHKIKPAYHLKRNGHTILEYKVSVHNKDFRAAYTQVGNEVNLFFISETTIKRHFVAVLEATTLVDK